VKTKNSSNSETAEETEGKFCIPNANVKNM
jgi:hypothetical protein